MTQPDAIRCSECGEGWVATIAMFVRDGAVVVDTVWEQFCVHSPWAAELRYGDEWRPVREVSPPSPTYDPNDWRPIHGPSTREHPVL